MAQGITVLRYKTAIHTAGNDDLLQEEELLNAYASFGVSDCCASGGMCDKKSSPHRSWIPFPKELAHETTTGSSANCLTSTKFINGLIMALLQAVHSIDVGIPSTYCCISVEFAKMSHPFLFGCFAT
ncbi:hypothetical protein BGZ54_006944 [Gamsiella multidivaricata]|nr:hypothetical protein BGZ54_006944 [Gamsiella multidivaricata]